MGSVLSVQVGVRDDASEVAVASVDVTVVSSTKPKIQAMPDQIELTRGSSKSVDVLANDVVTSELMPMTVIGVESQNSVAGVTATPSGDNRTVTVTATANATITTNLQLTYRVGDATGQKDRIVTGTITVVIVDVRMPPASRAICGKTRLPMMVRSASALRHLRRQMVNRSIITSCEAPMAPSASAAAKTRPVARSRRASPRWEELELRCHRNKLHRRLRRECGQRAAAD